MNLPLAYFAPPSLCPFPVHKLVFLVRLGFLPAYDQKEHLTEWYFHAVQYARQHALAEDYRRGRKRGNPSDPALQRLFAEYPELKPCTMLWSETILFGEIVKIPSMVTEPQLYEWKMVNGRLYMPYYTKLISDREERAREFNGLEWLHTTLNKELEQEGITDDFPAGTLWFLFTNRAQMYQACYGNTPEARIVISTLGDVFLRTYMANADMVQLATAIAAIKRGVYYTREKVMQPAPAANEE